MPSGQTHDRITLWLLPWIIGFTLVLTRNSRLTLIFASCFVFSGLMFGPDLDIYSVQFKRWGKIRFIWLPYQKIMSHRSFFSHGFLIGTVIRLLYLSIIVLMVAIFFCGIGQIIWGFDWNWQFFFRQLMIAMTNDHPGEFMAAFGGLEIGAMSHYLADWSKTAYKTYQKKGLKGFTPKKTASKSRRKKRKSPSIK